MKRAFVLLGLFGCAGVPQQRPEVEPPIALAPLGVKTVFQRLEKGFLKEDSPFVVVLTRPVGMVAHALALLDDSGQPIDGTSTWLDRQVVAFYPSHPVAPGLDLHLRIATALHTKDGSTLMPSEIATASTPTLESLAYTSVAKIHPVDEIHLAFDRDRALPLNEVESLGELSDETGPIPFVAHQSGKQVCILPKKVFQPGATLAFAWKSGPIAKTSLGRMHLPPYHGVVGRRLDAFIDEVGAQCHRVKGNDDKNWLCKGDSVHIALSAPIADIELAKHVHPALPRATTGDLRGHRLEVELGPKPVTIELEAKLEDVFGQRLKYPVTFVIRKTD